MLKTPKISSIYIL